MMGMPEGKQIMIRRVLLALVATAATAALAGADDRLWLPTGQSVTPTAGPSATFQPLNEDLPVVGKQIANGGVASLTSPDGHTLFVLTSGFNIWRDSSGKWVPEASTEHLFVYDISHRVPALKQDLHVPNAYGGMALSSDG
jgi:hypothetical protein